MDFDEVARGMRSSEEEGSGFGGSLQRTQDPRDLC